MEPFTGYYIFQVLGKGCPKFTTCKPLSLFLKHSRNFVEALFGYFHRTSQRFISYKISFAIQLPHQEPGLAGLLSREG